MAGLLARFAADRRGTAAIEFALIAPFMILLAAGIVEIGRVYKVYNAVDRLAAQYAAAWSDCSDQPAGQCRTELDNYTSSFTIANLVPNKVLRPANLTLRVFQVRMDAGDNPVVMVRSSDSSRYAYPAAATLTTAETTAVKSTLDPGQIGVIATASYTHTLDYFSNIMSTRLTTAKLSPSYTVVQLKY